MKNIILFFVLFIIASVCAFTYLYYFHGQKNIQKHTSILKVKGSLPYWDQEAAFLTIQKHPQSFDYINLFWYFIDKKGALQKYDDAVEDKNILEFAKVNNIKTSMVITNLPQEENTTWDSDRVAYVLHHADARKKEIHEITQKANELGFDSVIIDYESVSSIEKGSFSGFVQELSKNLHEHGLLLSVVLHPKTTDDDDPGGFQDWEKIAEYADQVQIMAYGEHWDEGEAGPIASIPWVDKVLSYAVSKDIPRNKIFLGIPLYGYSWQKNNDDKAKGLTYSDIKKLVEENNISPKWDNTAQSPYFIYTKKGNTFEVWYEDKQSISAKKDLASRFGIGGVTFWRLGGEDDSVWDLFSTSGR